MPEQWFRQAVIYCLDVDTYQDSDGDGIGDLPGLIDRLDHLASARREPVISGGEFGYETVNVDDQQQDPTSLLAWFQRAVLILRECPEFGIGTCGYLDTGE